VVRFALNADKPLNAKEQAVYCATWEEGFADIDAGRLKAAFVACLRSHTFKTIPTLGDIRQHLQKAEHNAIEEQAAQKWDGVVGYAERLSPDICEKNPRRISEQTRRAINAAGGLDYIRECDMESLQWARKRFVEAYVRYAELRQDEYLLPPGEARNLLAACAAEKSVVRVLEATDDRPSVPKPPKILDSRPIPPAVNEPTRVANSEGRRT
jgi:hypothetical protein